MLGLQAVPPCLSCSMLGMELKGFLYVRQALGQLHTVIPKAVSRVTPTVG